jgi:predicted outer membrane lipoprotein
VRLPLNLGLLLAVMSGVATAMIVDRIDSGVAHDT